MQTYFAEHLPDIEIIKSGSYYTPKNLVNLVHSLIEPYLKKYKQDAIIFDSSGGCGAFLFEMENYNYRAADKDLDACVFLGQHFQNKNIFQTNSLINVHRKKYSIPESSFLIMIGNPPYNDTTSEFKSGNKGQNICDHDLYDRDMGISFLKSYNKLNADIVCVLHPLSYLIKEANFKRLYDFKDNYRLIKGTIFSSSLFRGTGTAKFPILVSLYKKDKEGMSFEYIKNFKFDILNEKEKFILSNFKTSDGYINKYPPRKNDVKQSDIGLYYWTFRDFNSLRKNTSFFTKQHYNGIVVTLENFYKYAYLYSLKKLFNPENVWIYGNLSPLIDIDNLEKNKNIYISYAFETNEVFKQIDQSIVQRIIDYYGIKKNNIKDFDKIEKTIKNMLNKLV